MKYVKDFNEWAKDCYMEYRKKRDKSTTGRFIQGSAEVTFGGRRVFIIDTFTNKVGIAKCHPEDNFNFFIGLGVAYAKLTDKEIPKEIKTVEMRSLRDGQKFTYKDEQYIFISQSSINPSIYICERIIPGVGVGVFYVDGKTQVTVIE